MSSVTFQLVPVNCLRCGEKLDVHVNVTSTRIPGPNAIIVCGHCGSVQALDDHLQIRGLTNDEIARLRSDRPFVDALQRAVESAHFMKLEESR